MKLTANPAWLSLSPHGGNGSGAKFLRIMKLTTIIILAACLHTSAKGVAQQTITFSGKEVSLESVFTAIKKQTTYRFFFNTDMLTNASKVTIDVKNAQIEQVMNMALKDQPLTFTIKGRTIFIMKKPEEEKKVSFMNQKLPPIDVKGRVLNESGDPVEAVTVNIKGTSISVTTNLNGEFSLKGVSYNAIIVFTSVNMEPFEISVKSDSFLAVSLQTKVTAMQEVVINKGYYTEKKKFSTGNVSKVTSKEIEQQPVLNPLLALQGRVPGLSISQASGVPGSGITVRIQGLNSIAGGNDPLYVIDGMPYPSQMLPTTSVGGNILGGSSASFYSPGGSGNPLSYINANDIESIEVLKDADATSIYGSRAANGAILITTKSGKIGPTKVDLNLQQGWGKVTRSMDVMNTEQYLEMRNEAFTNDNVTVQPTDANYDINGYWDQSRHTDWVKTLIGGTAKYTNINATVSGGTSSMQYLVGATYKRETTVFPSEFNDQKASAHFSINSVSPNKRFRLNFTGSYMIDNNKLPQFDYTILAYTLPPNAPELYNVDGTLNWAPNLVGNSSWDNPLASKYRIYQNKSDNLISSALLSYTILKGVELSSRFGYTKLTTDEFATPLSQSQKPERRSNYQRSASYSTGVIKVFNVEPQLTFVKTFGNATIDILLGSSIQQQISNGQNLTGSGFLTDGLMDLRSAARVTVNSTVDAKYKYNAIFSRLNLNWFNRYIINLTARRDGSSRFGPENKFHNFASAGAAWIFSEENFFLKKMKFLSFGKLKASYGTTGSDQIGDYSYIERYISNNPLVPYQGANSIRTDRITNPYLQWEETRKLSMGLELGFMNDKIAINAVYGRNRSSNQLLSYSLPITAGFLDVDGNFPATVENTTWELSLTSVNIKGKNFGWTSSLNLTIPRNKLISFPNLKNSSYASSLAIGHPLSINRAFVSLGVDPNTGIYQFSAADGNVTNAPDFINDPTKWINIDPKLYGGIQSNIRFKQLQIDFLFSFIKQTQKNDHYFGLGSLPPGIDKSNQPLSVLRRWRKPGDNTAVQRYGQDFSILFDPYNSLNNSDAAYEDASYMRLENLSVSYNLTGQNLQRLRMKQCKLYLSGQNLLTLSGFGGIDPENRSLVSLTPLKMYTIGIQVGF